MRVAILGCGYLGIELGRRLARDHEVVGVRRSRSGLEAIERAGFDAIRADLTAPATLQAVPDVDAVVFAASSGSRDAAGARRIYVEAQRGAIDHFRARSSPPERYLYTSSTGVYGDHDGAWVDESTPPEPETARGRALLEAERLVRDRASGTVLRLGGLYGPDRYRLDRYLEGPVTEGYLNLIHRDDAAGAAAHLLETRIAPEAVVLGVDDEPVEKWTLADWLATECGEPAPQKRTVAERLAAEDLPESRRRRLRARKRCRNDKLRDLGYDLEYPTYREGYQPAVDAYRSSEAT